MNKASFEWERMGSELLMHDQGYTLITSENLDQVMDAIQDTEIMRMEVEDPEGGWMVSRLKCISCFEEFIGVYLLENDAQFMKCSRCKKLSVVKLPLEERP